MCKNMQDHLDVMGIDEHSQTPARVGILTKAGTITTPFDSCPWCWKRRCIERAEEELRG